MRTLILAVNVSLDGYLEGPGGSGVLTLRYQAT
jgi:hypothetical protein